MASFEEFSRELNRMPLNTRSSLINESNTCNPCDPHNPPPGACPRKGQTSSFFDPLAQSTPVVQPYYDSPYPIAQGTPRTQRNADNAQLCARDACTRPRRGDPNTCMATPRRGPCGPVNSNNLIGCRRLDTNRQQGNESRRVCFDQDNDAVLYAMALQATQGYRGDSCRPIAAADLGLNRGPAEQTPRGSLGNDKQPTSQDALNLSARTMNVSDLTSDEASKLKPRRAVYNAAGRPLEKTEFRGAGPQPSEGTCAFKPSGRRKQPPRGQDGGYNVSGRPFNLSEYVGGAPGGPQQPDQFNASGRPFNLSEYMGGAPGGPQQPDQFNASGRPFNLSEYVAGLPARPQQPPQGQIFNAAGRPFDLSEYVACCGGPQQPTGRVLNVYEYVGGAGPRQQPAAGQLRSCNTSGWPFNLSEYLATASGGQQPGAGQSSICNASGRPFNLSEYLADVGGGPQAPQDQNEPYNTSGRPLNLSEFAGPAKKIEEQQPPSSNTYTIADRSGNLDDQSLRVPSLQAQSESGRPLNVSSFSGQAPQRQDSSTVGRQPSTGDADGRYLQVPREEFGHSGQGLSRQELSRTMQMPHEQYDSSRGMSGSLQSAQHIASSCGQRDTDAESHQSKTQFQESPCQSQRSPAEKRSTGTCPLTQKKVPSATLPPPGTGMPHCQFGTPECPSLSQQQLVQFLQYGDLSQILAGEPLSNIPRSPLFNTLVKDNYHPGAIEDAVNGQIDFNRIAFDAVFDNKQIPAHIEPDDVPMSLLEAFELRIRYENDLRENLERRREFCLAEQKKEVEARKKTGAHKKPMPASLSSGAQDSSSSSSTSDAPEPLPDQTQFWTHRDELKLATTIDIDLAKNYRDHPETGLTEALSSLFKAEKMNDFDKYVHVAEEAIRFVSPDEHEKAALKSTCTFQVDMHKEEGVSKKTYKPIEIISYIGTTKPK